MLNFKPSKLSLALISSGLIAASVSSFAVQAADTANKKEKEIEVIEVTGIRGSLQRAQAIKMSSSSIVEVLSAEDIGKLPDTSIAESLARLPGVTGERRNGRTSGLSVRGFNENYIGTSLNGRELLGMGDNRGVEFDLYPTEFISNIVVYKTPEAGLMNQGLAGTVDLQTITPLTAKKALVFNANYEKNATSTLNPDYGNDGKRFSLNYVDQFGEDLGLALVIATQETPRQEEQFRAWGYATVDKSSPRRATDTVDVPDGTVIIGGQDSLSRSALLKRDSVAATIQYAPSDNLMLQFDALYIDFSESDTKRGIESGGPQWGVGGNYTITGVENGVATSGYYDGFADVIRNDGQTQASKLSTFGFNAEYIVNDDWTATLDLSTGRVTKRITDIESYSGTGRAGSGAGYARSFQNSADGVTFSDHPTLGTIDYTDASLITLAGPQSWGGGMSSIPGQFFGTTDAQDGFVNRPDFNESLTSARFEVEGVLEYGIFNGITIGVNYSDRSKTKNNNGDFLTASTYGGTDVSPTSLGTVNLPNGLGSIIAYDSMGLYNQGFYTRTNAITSDTNRLGDTYTTDETLITAFTKLDIEAELGDVLVSGNIGLQVVNVDQNSGGFGAIAGANGLVVRTPISDGDSYTDVLPTLNLSFEVAENQFIRTSLAKVQSRPRLDDMKVNNTITFQFNDQKITSTDPENSAWSGNTGNAKLRPLEANQFDLSYENYFASDGYFAVSFFFKDLTNWQKADTSVADFAEFYIPGVHQTSGLTDLDGDGNPDPVEAPATFLGGVSTISDGLTGYVRGYELQASVPLRLLSPVLDGFGVVASATYLDGQLDVAEGDEDRVPGLSKESYSFTTYYEKGGFEARISGVKRSSFLTESRGLSLALQDTSDDGVEQIDAQISYDFTKAGIKSLEGLTISLQGQNLTDQPTVQTAGPGQIVRYQLFGANYLLNLNYKF
jgi:iron complex outermembrane recepter protein